MLLCAELQQQRALQHMDELGAGVFVWSWLGDGSELHPIGVQLPLGRGEVQTLELPRDLAAAELFAEAGPLRAPDDAEGLAGGGREEVIEADPARPSRSSCAGGARGAWARRRIRADDG